MPGTGSAIRRSVSLMIRFGKAMVRASDECGGDVNARDQLGLGLEWPLFEAVMWQRGRSHGGWKRAGLHDASQSQKNLNKYGEGSGLWRRRRE